MLHFRRTGGSDDPRARLAAAVLTPEQTRAVRSKAHALLVRAGAGTGKTTTLAHRLARLAREGAPEHRLLAVTFTRDATAALSRKIGALLGRGHGVRVASFHQWAAREVAGDAPRYLGQDEARAIVLRALARRPPGPGFSRALGAGAHDDVAARVLAFVSYVKNAQTSVAGAVEAQFPALASWQGELEALEARYEEAKAERLDYDDLLLFLREKLGRPAFRREVAGRLDHLAVDEYQDVNGAQADIVRLLTVGRGGVPVTVVGDPRQSIYGFRGASGAHVDAFLDAHGKRAREVALTVSFRSTRALVAAGNALLPDAHPLRARPKAPRGRAPVVLALEDATEEARAVADHLARVLSEGAQPADCVVLVRSRNLAARFVEEARERGGALAEVRIATIHAAKGLEWEHVVLMGAREGGLPSVHALARAELVAEERRLLYVAATRARTSLLVTWPMRGERAAYEASRFLRCWAKDDEKEKGGERTPPVALA